MTTLSGQRLKNLKTLLGEDIPTRQADCPPVGQCPRNQSLESFYDPQANENQNDGLWADSVANPDNWGD